MFFLQLPDELILLIYQVLRVSSSYSGCYIEYDFEQIPATPGVFNLALVCKRLYSIISGELWKRVSIEYFRKVPYTPPYHKLGLVGETIY